MANFYPFLSLDCAGLEGEEERKEKEGIQFCSIA